MINTEHLWLAFGLTMLAGLSTGIGSTLAFFAKPTNKKFLSTVLGFSAGVMLYVSFIEIFPVAQEILIKELGEVSGTVYTVVGFFAGIFIIGVIDRIIPYAENPHELKYSEEMQEPLPGKGNEKVKDKYLARMGLFTALAIAIHNFPEGMVTFFSTIQDPVLGISLAIAISIHNIPEGIAISVPIYYATHDRKKAFLYSFFSGLAEPIGAIAFYLILMPFFNDVVFGLIFSAVGGVMVFISLDELLPAAQKYGAHHHSIYGLILGMIVMAISLLIAM